MSKSLIISDRIMANSNKKIVFNTNLEKLTAVDSALLRKGRCFDIIKFLNLVVDSSTVNYQKCNSLSINSKT